MTALITRLFTPNIGVYWVCCIIWLFCITGSANTESNTEAKATQANINSKTIPRAHTGDIEPMKDLDTVELDHTPDVKNNDPVQTVPHVNFGIAAKRLWLESAGMVGLLTYTGFSDWKWGTASFRFNSEGWFGMDTGSGGMDKLGHLYGTYAISELLYWRLHYYFGDTPEMTIYPAAFSMLLMLYVELFDGFSVDHGWSWEDVVMDAIGAGFSFLQYALPITAALFDLRYEYFPSKGQKGFHPIIDYAGQKYLFVFKFAGFERLLSTPFGYLELMVGYYARGFLKHESNRNERETKLFVGVGLNLEQLFLKPFEKKFTPRSNVLSKASHYFQAPYTYLPVTVSERHGPRRAAPK